MYKITDLITASALGHDFCRHAEHTSIQPSARRNSISPESVCTPTGDDVPAGATAVVAFVVAFARDQYDPGMTVPAG
jgi:hypothetical protein